MMLVMHPETSMKCTLRGVLAVNGSPITTGHDLPRSVSLAEDYERWAGNNNSEYEDEWGDDTEMNLPIVWKWLSECWKEAGGLLPGTVRVVMAEKGTDNMAYLDSAKEVPKEKRIAFLFRIKSKTTTTA